MMYLFTVIALVFLFGLAIGSFVNVVIYRTLNGGSPLEGRSRCPECKQQIRAWDNIPLLSYFFLSGRCRNCKAKISLMYPVVEFLTGTLFVWWYAAGSLFFHLTQSPFIYIQPMFWLGTGIIFLAITVADLRFGLIPDVLVFILALWTIAYRLILTAAGIMQVSDFWLSLASGMGAALFFAFLVLVTRGRGMGMGDVKLAAVLGFILGWPRTGVGLMASFILGSLAAILLLVLGKKKFGQTIPFGPFMILGAAVALFWGNSIWLAYFSHLF